jgi:hypothetical protein
MRGECDVASLQSFIGESVLSRKALRRDIGIAGDEKPRDWTRGPTRDLNANRENTRIFFLLNQELSFTGRCIGLVFKYMLFIFLLVCLSEFVASVELSDWAMQSSAKLPSNITGFIISSPGFDTSSWSAAHKRVFHHQYYLGIQSLFLARFLLAWLKTTSIKICTWIKIC